MAEREISVVFQSRYEGDIGRHLRAEREKFREFQSWLTSNALEVAVTVNMNGIKAQVDQARQIIASGLSGAMKGPSILGADGAPAVAATTRELAKAKGMLQEISTMTFGLNDAGELVKTGDFLKQVEQIGNGLERVSRFKKDEAGDWQLLSSAEKDVRTVKQLEDGLRSINKELGSEFSNAKGRGDKNGQLEALKKQKSEVDRLLNEAAKGGLVGSSAFTRGENQQDRLAARISQLQGQGLTDAQKKAEANRKLQIDRAIKAEESRATAALKANKLEMDQAERLLPDRVKYEAELNRLYQERVAIFQRSKAVFQQMDKDLLHENRPDLANKAFNRGLNAESQVNQAHVDHSRAFTDSQRRADQEREKTGQASLRKNVAEDQKRIREEAAARQAAQESAFRQELQDIKSQMDRRIAAINAAEKRMLAETKTARQRSVYQTIASEQRQTEFKDAARRYGSIEQNARSGGHVEIADQARGRAGAVITSAARDMAKFEEATRRSGHALDFHSGSLLRNAATFLRWQIPMKAVMAVQMAFQEGVQSAIRVERQFATLQTVFNGTAEEAQALKKETLDLAIAQGRSADEAMDSAIRWSRLGMTRLQVIESTRVSLMAANVAEITAAESAEKLSGIYATYKLNVGDLAGVLNSLNSISNNYNVTVKDLFEGIARVSGVARQSGLELRDLEGIIGSVTGASGRPGQEIGNALKTIITRIADPKTGAALKKAFDIDLTGPNGDLKDMSQILRELADIYPTLNKAEQQRFLMLTAGTRQASRMAQVMTEYRQGQILAAQAGFDHAASERENEKILLSLQSRIEAVKASWTELATAFGDAGGFEKAGDFLRMIQLWVKSVGDGVDEAKKKARSFVINDVKMADTVSMLGGVGRGYGLRSKFERSEAEKALAALKEAQATFSWDPATGGMKSDKPFLSYFGNIDRNKTNIGGTKVTGDYEGISDAIKKLEELLSGGGDNGFTDGLRKSTAQVANLRSEVDSLKNSAWVFDSMAKGVTNGSLAGRELNREFQSAANLLLSLPDGQKAYNDAVKEFNDLSASGDGEKLAALLDRLAKLFGSATGPKAEELRSVMAATTTELDKQVADLEAKKAKLMEGGSSSYSDEVKEISDKVKNLRDAISTVNAKVEELDKQMTSAFGVEGSRKISNYIDDLLAAAKSFGEAFKDFGLNAEDDPVSRIMQRHRQAVELGRQSLIDLQRETRKQSDADRSTAAGETDPQRKKKLIDQANEADELAKSKIDKADEDLEKLRRELDYENAILNIKRRQTDASKQAADSSRAWRVGEMDSDKDANQANAAIERARRTVADAGGNWLINRGEPGDRAESLGTAAQDEATARNNLQSMIQRNYDIDAARRQIAIDTAKAMREQTEEASKRFQFASREDHLRAAAIANTVKRGGKLSQDEFMMLSQGTRQAIGNYLPSMAPGPANEVKVKADKERRDLDAEQERLKASIEYVSSSLRSLSENITRGMATGGPLDPLTGAIPTRPLQNAANTRGDSPVVNLNVSSVAVQVQLADQLGSLLRGYVDNVVATEVRGMEARLRQQPVPNPQGSVE